MAGKQKSVYVCSECGGQFPKWSGKCALCGEWNTIQEEIVAVQHTGASTARRSEITMMDNIDTQAETRYLTGIGELDRVLGGGIVPGGLMLIGGDPGIGKSTLLLQMCGRLSENFRILYVSGEESARQIKLRAERLSVGGENLLLLCETDMDAILDAIRTEKPNVVIVDSIQTVSLSDVTSSPGSVTQVRECAAALMREAKQNDIPVFIVGHVNKDGAIAGPKVMEHIVDCVLYFEGDPHSNYRMLRCAKNRYGSTNEIGVFEMQHSGLCEVENPSIMLLSGRPKNVSGTCVACVMEGTRPLLAEVQGLVSPTGFGNPRRMSTGFDGNRLALLLAVLEKRAGYFFSNLDTYLNVVGGLRLEEPAADLPVALALISGLKDKPMDEGVVAFGEIGLAGELRAVSGAEQRIAEAARLGFTRIIVPAHTLKCLHGTYPIEVIGAATVREAYEKL